jgi:TetR/AcrR family transcriptional regulator, mexJK operon transcriptional repressor
MVPMKIGKRESQRLEKRAQIIAIARQHFFEHGYDNTTMSAIAAQLGGSKRTLWSYFSDKDELFEAMLMDTAAGIRAQIDLPSEQGDPVERLTRLCRSIIDRVLSPMVIAMFRLVGPLADRRPDISRMFFERGPGETQRLIGNYLRDNFADILWTTDFKAAGIDLVAFSSSEMHFERMWGLNAAPTAKEKDAQARRGALLFLRAYAREPDVVVPRDLLSSPQDGTSDD